MNIVMIMESKAMIHTLINIKYNLKQNFEWSINGMVKQIYIQVIRSMPYINLLKPSIVRTK